MSKPPIAEAALGLELDITLYAEGASIAQAAHIEAIAELLKLAAADEALAIAALALSSAVGIRGPGAASLEMFPIAHQIHWLHLCGLDRNQKLAIAGWILANVFE